MGMLGLPYLTRIKGFSAKVYATEATARFGQLMMDDLVSVHSEFRQFYGSKDSSFPQWMTWEMLELLPSSLREVAYGEDGEELGGWMPLYSAADVSQCIQKDKRTLAMFNYEEKAKREQKVMSDLQRLVQWHIGQDVGPNHDPFSGKASDAMDV